MTSKMGAITNTMISKGFEKSIGLLSLGLGVPVGVCTANGTNILNIFLGVWVLCKLQI